MTNIFKLNLQLFADGGDGGGEGATNGENSGDPGQSRLLELGVPADKIRKRQKKSEAPLPKGAVLTEGPEQTEQVAAAKPTEETETNKRMTMDEIMADPDYNKEIQSIVQSRLKTAKAAEENLQKLAPALEVIARKYGMDVDKLDYDALAKAVNDDDLYYEDKALEKGGSIEAAKAADQKAREEVRQQKAEQRTLEQQAVQQHIQRLEREGTELKKMFPNFDLRKELENPAFARMTAPGKGIMSVEDAYRAVHRKEIEAASAQVIAQKTTQKISASIQSGSRRPEENGTSGQAASVTAFDYSKASPKEREALKREIRRAAARGQKLYPGR